MDTSLQALERAFAQAFNKRDVESVQALGDIAFALAAERDEARKERAHQQGRADRNAREHTAAQARAEEHVRQLATLRALVTRLCDTTDAMGWSNNDGMADEALAAVRAFLQDAPSAVTAHEAALLARGRNEALTRAIAIARRHQGDGDVIALSLSDLMVPLAPPLPGETPRSSPGGD